MAAELILPPAADRGIVRLGSLHNAATQEVLCRLCGSFCDVYKVLVVPSEKVCFMEIGSDNISRLCSALHGLVLYHKQLSCEPVDEVPEAYKVPWEEKAHKPKEGDSGRRARDPAVPLATITSVSTHLRMTNVPTDADEAKLRTLFAHFNNAQRVCINAASATATVTMPSVSDAVNALIGLQGVKLPQCGARGGQGVQLHFQSTPSPVGIRSPQTLPTASSSPALPIRDAMPDLRAASSTPPAQLSPQYSAADYSGSLGFTPQAQPPETCSPLPLPGASPQSAGQGPSPGGTPPAMAGTVHDAAAMQPLPASAADAAANGSMSLPPAQTTVEAEQRADLDCHDQEMLTRAQFAEKYGVDGEGQLRWELAGQGLSTEDAMCNALGALQEMLAGASDVVTSVTAANRHAGARYEKPYFPGLDSMVEVGLLDVHPSQQAMEQYGRSTIEQLHAIAVLQGLRLGCKEFMKDQLPHYQ